MQSVVSALLSRGALVTADAMDAVLCGLDPELLAVPLASPFAARPGAGEIKEGSLVVATLSSHGIVRGLVYKVISLGTGNSGFGEAGSCSLRRLMGGEDPKDGKLEWITVVSLAVAGEPLGTPLHLACLFGRSGAVVSVVGKRNPRASEMQDGYGRTPLVGLRDEGALTSMVRGCPDAAQHESCRRLLRECMAEARLPLLRAFAPAAAVVFDEYAQWRAETQRDIVYPAMAEATGHASIDGEALPCEPLVRLLLEGADNEFGKEFLLGQAAQASSPAFARVLLERFGATGLAPLPSLAGRTARDLGVVSPLPEVAALFRPLGALLGRYLVARGHPVHNSATSVVRYAEDVTTGALVALKFMRHYDEFGRELSARGGALEAQRGLLVRVLACHVPAGVETSLGAWGGLVRRERTEAGASHPYLIVMERAGESLHHFLSSQRVAGYEVAKAASLARALARQLVRLHGCGVVHFDVKARNALLANVAEAEADAAEAPAEQTALTLGSSESATGSASEEASQVVLCDMDASAAVGARRVRGEKLGSGAYCAPEVAQLMYGLTERLEADPKLDVWSFGALLFAMATGRHLFPQDIANDELAGPVISLARLLAWHTITNEELEEVFAFETGPMAGAARHLIRWCLKGDPVERPTMAQVAEHPFLATASDGRVQATLQPPMSMKFRAFISHEQADSAGTARSLHSLLGRKGIHCWLDMLQAELTLEGMKRGVFDSNVFLLVLTESVLTCWFCQQELLEAIRLGKPIVILIEVDARFKPFPIAEWMSGGSGVRSFCANTVDQEAICVAIDIALPNAIPYRRRDHEADAMVQALAARMGVELPTIETIKASTTRILPVNGIAPGAVQPLSVAVICSPSDQHRADFAAALMSELLEQAQLSVFEPLTAAEVEGADRVLVLLSEGVLTGPSLDLLRAAIIQDAARSPRETGRVDRLIFVCRAGPPSCLPSEGWSFQEAHNQELRECAVPEVKDAILNHEAVTYRAPSEGGSRHEFPAMVAHLLALLGRPHSTAASPTPSETPADAPPSYAQVTASLTAARAAEAAEREARVAAEVAEAAARAELSAAAEAHAAELAAAAERERMALEAQAAELTAAAERERVALEAASDRERALLAEIAALRAAASAPATRGV